LDDMFHKNLRELPPFGDTLGMDWVESVEDKVRVRLCPSDRVRLSKSVDAYHPGAILATLDNACGWCIRQHPRYTDGTSMATLNLRVDLLERAPMTGPLLVTARCDSYDGEVAHVRGEARYEDSQHMVATVQATFMLGTPNLPREAVETASQEPSR
jgi:acyl-coenzyme A thioesterase PaaI-like protein